MSCRGISADPAEDRIEAELCIRDGIVQLHGSCADLAIGARWNVASDSLSDAISLSREPSTGD